MNKTRLLTIAVFGLLILNLGILIFIFFNKQHGPPGRPLGGPNGEGPKQIIIERLNFDATQQKQYDVIVEEHRAKTKELNKASRELHDDLYSDLKNNIIDNSKKDSLIQKIADNRKAIEDLNFDHFQKIKSICKPEQLERYNGLVEDLAQLFSPHQQGPPK